MKKLFSALILSLFAASALMTSCSDVPAPFEITTPEEQETVGDGSKENPYNVETASLKQDGSTSWVQGYIVGVMETDVDPFSPSFTAPFKTNSNIMIADSKDEQDKKKCLIVQLPAGNIRTSLNLKDNEGNKGKPVSLQGKLTAYFSSNGLKEVAAGILDGKEIGSEETSTDKDNPFGLDASKPVDSFKADFNEQPDFVDEGKSSNQNYDYQLAGWKNLAKVGDRKWSGVVSKANEKYIQASAFKGKEEVYEMWFISPAFKVDAVESKKVSFDCAGAFFNEGNSLKVFFLELQNGKMVQEEIIAEGIPTSGENYAWAKGITVDIAKYSGKVGFIGFQYISHSTNSTTYQLDNIQTGISEGGNEGTTEKDNPFGLDASKPVDSFKADFNEQPDFVDEGKSSNQNYDYQLAGWKNLAKVGDRKWTGVVSKTNEKYIQASAFKGKEDVYEMWFISPAFKVDAVQSKKVSFDCAGAFFNEGNSLKVFFLELQNGKMVQEEIIAEGVPTSGENYAWAKGITVDIAKYSGKVGFIGF